MVHKHLLLKYDALYIAADRPIGVDPRQRLIGNVNKENIQQALRTLAIYPFTRFLGMTMEEVDSLVDRARADAANQDLKAYFPL